MRTRRDIGIGAADNRLPAGEAMMDVEVSIAERSERTAIANLIQLYTHDFSQYWAGRPEGELEDDGRYPDYPLDVFWETAGHVPCLIRVGGWLAGFALINQASRTGRPVDWNMAEFFVVRKHRRRGVGREAAHLVFGRHPGQWEVAVARRNGRAWAFWWRTIRECPLVDGIELHDVTGPVWDGPVMRFHVG